MTTQIQKKSVVRIRHQRAIGAFISWCGQNPKASQKEKYEYFDFYVDQAAVAVEENRA